MPVNASAAGRDASRPWRAALGGGAAIHQLPQTSVALTATIYNFDVQLSDVDRNVYAAFAIRAARQPSETAEYLLTRVLAYCFEYGEGIAFSRGLAEPDEPPLAIRDLTGALQTWIEIGAPDAGRVHKASKASPRVVVYTHKDAALLVRQLSSERIHRAGAVEIYAVDRALLAELATRLERRMVFELAVTNRHLYLTLGGVTLDGVLTPYVLTAP